MIQVSTPDPVDSVVMVYNVGGYGSGAIIGPDCVLTARHMTINEGIRVTTADGADYEVVRVVQDKDSDLALLYIDGQFDEVPLVLDPTPLKVGDEVIVIGTPMGEKALMNCVVTGRVVKVDVETPLPGVDSADMYDVHAGPGFSGGPVLDNRGRIRGVHTVSVAALGGGVPVGELDVP